MPTITKEQALAVFEMIAPQLARDPLFNDGAEIETMRRLLAYLPPTADALFGVTLRGGPPAYRYAGLRLYADLVRLHRALEEHAIYDGSLTVEGNESFCYRGDLRVDGDLVLAAGATFVVAGELEVRGAVLGAGAGYSLLAVAGTMSAHDVMTAGDLIVGQRLAVTNVAYFQGGAGGTTLAPAARARVLVQDESRADHLLKARAASHFTATLHRLPADRLAAIATTLGIDPATATSIGSVEHCLRGLLRRA